MEKENIQTTVNSNSLDVLVEDGEIENVYYATDETE